MRVGVLTGGGDCPGLNAVIRAVVRKGVTEYGYEFVGFRDGWRGPARGRRPPSSASRRCAASCPRGGTILGSSRTNPFKIEGGVEQIKDNLADARRRRADRDRRRGHARRRDQAARPRRQRRRRAQDDRQRPRRHRLHLRLRHRGQHRDGGDRPAAHHGRVAPPRAGRRGDGPARRLDRPARRPRRRRQRHPDPRAAVRHRRRSARYVEQRFESHYSPIIVVAEGAMPGRGRRHDPGRPARRTRSATSGSAASATGWPSEIEKRTGKEARAVVLGHVQRGGTPTALRPLAGHPLRAARHRRRARRRLRQDGGAARHRHRRGSRSIEGDRRAQDRRPAAVRRGRGLLRLSPSRWALETDRRRRLAGCCRRRAQARPPWPTARTPGGRACTATTERARRQRARARPQAGDGPEAAAAVHRRRHPRRRRLRRHRRAGRLRSAASPGCRSWWPSSSRR